MFAATMARHDMVDREMVRLDATVLAAEIVATKNRATRKLDPRSRSAHLMRQSNDGWKRKRGGRRVDVPAAVHDNFRFAANEQHHRAMRVAHIQRLVVLIEDEDLMPHAWSILRAAPAANIRGTRANAATIRDLSCPGFLRLADIQMRA